MKVENPASFFSLPEDTLTVISASSILGPPLDPASSKGLVLETANGRKEVTPEWLGSAVSAFGSAMVIGLADEPLHGASNKRVGKAFDRTQNWLRSANDACSQDTALIGPVLASEARPSTRGMKPSQEVDLRLLFGGAISGLGCGESADERVAAAKAALATLRPEQLRIAVRGFSTPSDILDAVELGVDIIGSSYPFTLARKGQALTMPLRCHATVEPPKKRRKSENGLHVLNLLDACHRKDPGPILESCGCHACSHHTRAYIHHLLLAHEMLADVLLQIHNLYHLHNFVDEIRARIKDGTFNELRGLIDADVAPRV